jgi:IS30 family transposase
MDESLEYAYIRRNSPRDRAAHQNARAIRRRDHDGEPVREIARSYNVHNSTISRLMQ